MKLENWRGGEVIAVLPELTLIKETAPPFEYKLIPGGFLNSKLSDGSFPKKGQVISYDITLAKDGSMMSYLDK